MKFYFKDKSKKFNPQLFKKIAKSVFKKLRINDRIEIGLVITDNLGIKKLNSKYRNINSATDVLSFPVDLPAKNSKYTILGDIVISSQIAEDYAQKNNKDTKTEIITLFKHGLLHLLGYDHEKNKKEWQQMEKLINN